MKIIAIVCMALGLAYGGYLAALYLGQDGMVFPLRKADPQRVAEIHRYYPQLTDFKVTAADGTVLAGYFLPRQNDGRLAPAVLYFAGNAENQSSFFLWSPGELPDWTVAGVDYRGYGDSGGRPTETGLKSDALAVYDALAAKLGPQARIVVMGRSLGTALAASVAANRPVAGLILVTPFDSLAAVGQQSHPMVPVRLLMKYPFDVLPDAAKIDVPTLLLVAGADTLVPPVHAERLAAAWTGPKEVQTVVGATHASIIDNPMYWKLIREYLRERLR